MIKRLCRWILREEILTEECIEAFNERFSNIESKQYDDAKLIQRHESQLRLMRENMSLLQTRQAGLMNAIARLEHGTPVSSAQPGV